MLASLPIGLDRSKAVYARAIEQSGRFYSCGDASLPLPSDGVPPPR